MDNMRLIKPGREASKVADELSQFVLCPEMCKDKDMILQFKQITSGLKEKTNKYV